MDAKGQPTDDEFFLLGEYSPREATRLLERFEKAGILFQAKPVKHSYHPRMTVAISVELRRAADANKIHEGLFGNGLPNYSSSFFREHRNVSPDDEANDQS